MRRACLLLLLFLVACGSPAPPEEPNPTPPPPPETESLFTAAITYNDFERDDEVYLQGGSAEIFRSQGRLFIRCELVDGNDSLLLTLELPDLDQTEYEVGTDLSATLRFVEGGEVVFDGPALSGALDQVNDPDTFVGNLLLEFPEFFLGAAIGFPR